MKSKTKHNEFSSTNERSKYLKATQMFQRIATSAFATGNAGNPRSIMHGDNNCDHVHLGFCRAMADWSPALSDTDKHPIERTLWI